MSEQFHNNVLNLDRTSNIIPFPVQFKMPTAKIEEPIVPTPVYDKLVEVGTKLDQLSKYPSTFDYEVYKNLELRYKDKPIFGGITMKTAFRLVNAHATCQQCLYTFEIDTYGRGCAHNCVYCYAKAELIVHGYWNNPIPVPIDINEIRKVFYTVFETNKKSKWRDILERRIPLRIGSMSDSFMWADTKYKVTQELLKILKYYNYPYVIFTRSDLVAHDDYMKLIDPKLASIQFSMSSTNEELLKKIEPGAPSAKRRLKALQKLSENGFWTTVRINPLFPIRPDGYFTDPNFKWEGEVPQFDFTSFEMIDEIADHKVPAVLAGFGRFSKISMNATERAIGFNLRQFFNHGNRGDTSWRDYKFSDKEIRYYYEQLKQRCSKRNIQFTTCYIGNGEGHFWKDQDLWSNKKDCCNIKNRVPTFTVDSRSIPFEKRLQFTNHKNSVPSSDRLHDTLGESSGVSLLKTTDSDAII